MTILTKKKQRELIPQLFRLQELVKGLPPNYFFEATNIIINIVVEICDVAGLHYVIDRIDKEMDEVE